MVASLQTVDAVEANDSYARKSGPSAKKYNKR